MVLREMIPCYLVSLKKCLDYTSGNTAQLQCCTGGVWDYIGSLHLCGLQGDGETAPPWPPPQQEAHRQGAPSGAALPDQQEPGAVAAQTPGALLREAIAAEAAEMEDLRAKVRLLRSPGYILPCSATPTLRGSLLVLPTCLVGKEL